MNDGKEERCPSQETKYCPPNDGCGNKTQAEECKYSIPETGVGAKPFNLTSTQQQENSSKDPVKVLIAKFVYLKCTSDLVPSATHNSPRTYDLTKETKTRQNNGRKRRNQSRFHAKIYCNPKQRCNYWQLSEEGLKGLPAVLGLMTGAFTSYIRAGGQFGSTHLTNTCVLDTILAALHICYIKYPNVKSLLQSSTLFHVIMCYLNKGQYDDAKVLCLRHLKMFSKQNVIDIAGTVKYHLPMFAELVCAEVDYNQETPSDSEIYTKTLSKFRALGNLKALGDESNPALILVDPDVGFHHERLHRLDSCVKDDLNRIFELDFLLIGRENHMVMCFSMSKNMWILYDDDPSKPAFQLFNYQKELQSYGIYLAGYVNESEAEECKYSIAETGAGAKPFNSGSTQQQENSCKDPVENLPTEVQRSSVCDARGVRAASMMSWRL